MGRYLIKRLIVLPVSLLVISGIVFSLIHLVPGTPIDSIVGVEASPELRNELTRYYGLDLPLSSQFALWASRVLRGDLGRSILTSRPVLTELLQRFPATWLLATLALALAISISFPLGILAASKPNSSLDRFIMSLTAIELSIPLYVIAIVLILIFGVTLKVLPTAGAPSLINEPIAALPYYVLPTVSLSVALIGAFSRLLRASLLEVLNQDYIKVAWAKGLHARRVLAKHALANALIPVVTVVAISYGHLLGGAVIAEAIFGIPGIGTLLVKSVLQRDFPLIQGVALSVALFFIVINLLVDVLYAYLDPRIRYQ